jgi:AcrR family transcriptional regulator
MTVARRSDGEATRDRLMEAAGIVFAEKGYRRARVSEICDKASANVAAVNYHFGGKEQLYAEVWRAAYQESVTAYPPDGGLPPTAEAEERLRMFIRSMVFRILKHGPESTAGRILLQEMMQPTPVIGRVLRDAIRPIELHAIEIGRALLGTEAPELTVRYCLMSVVHQCLAIGFKGGQKPPILGRGRFSDDEIDGLVEHIYRFSRGGIEAIRASMGNGRGVAGNGKQGGQSP